MSYTVVLVCGGREYGSKVEERIHVYATLDQMKAHYGELLIVQGGARGADGQARFWSEDRAVHCATVPAIWNKLGNAAGAIRNSAMLALQPQVCIGFPGGRGTADMLKKARAAGVATYEV